MLTCPWHARDAQSLVKRIGATVFVPPPDEGDPSPVEGQVFRAGERLPVGVEAFPGLEPNDLVLWVESRGALVAGDTLIDRGNGLEFPVDWENKGVPPEQILEALRPLLELPVELSRRGTSGSARRRPVRPRSTWSPSPPALRH